MSKKIEQPKPQIETKLSDRILSDAELDGVSGGSSALQNTAHTSISEAGEALKTFAQRG